MYKSITNLTLVKHIQKGEGIAWDLKIIYSLHSMLLELSFYNHRYQQKCVFFICLHIFTHCSKILGSRKIFFFLIQVHTVKFSTHSHPSYIISSIFCSCTSCNTYPPCSFWNSSPNIYYIRIQQSSINWSNGRL